MRVSAGSVAQETISAILIFSVERPLLQPTHSFRAPRLHTLLVYHVIMATRHPSVTRILRR